MLVSCSQSMGSLYRLNQSRATRSRSFFVTTAGFSGVSIWPAGAYRTPLGDLPIDSDLAKRLPGDGDPRSDALRGGAPMPSYAVDLLGVDAGSQYH